MVALVVDDSRTTRSLLANIMEGCGFTVVEACDGVQALERLGDFPDISIALVDWNMPKMNGYDFVCEVRKNSDFKDLTVMMVTTEADLAHVTAALEAGADEYVMKPFTQQIMQEKLALLGIEAG